MLDGLSVLAPVQCAGCGTPDRAVCPACSAHLGANPSQTATPAGLPVVSGLNYAGVARRVILALKEQGRTDAAAALADPFAGAVLAAVGTHAAGTVELVTPPSSRVARRRRGFDPVTVLLAAARLPPPSRVLRRTRRGEAQKALDRDHRASNAGGSLRATRPLTGRTFVLVDDVLTTGSTLDEAARAITEAGGVVVCGAVLAFTRLRSRSGGSRS